MMCLMSMDRKYKALLLTDVGDRNETLQIQGELKDGKSQKGELQLSLGKQKLTARLTIDSLIRIENSIGGSIVQIAQRLSEGKATVTEIVNVLTPAIKGGGNDVDAKQVQQWVWEAGLIEGMRCAGEIVTMALNSGQNEGNEGAEENPAT